jgi:hypothetical protein
MAVKTNFTPEEWGRVLANPLVAAMAITAADPTGLWGLLKESLSGGFAILEARQDTNANPLVKDVARDFATPEGRPVSRAALQARFSGLKIDAVKDAALDELKAVSPILVSKRQATLMHSRLGFRTLPARLPRPDRKAASWDLEASPSANRRRLPLRTSPDPWDPLATLQADQKGGMGII